MTILGIPVDEFRRQIERETKRLYSEERMSGDEMRNMAHRLSTLLGCIIDGAKAAIEDDCNAPLHGDNPCPSCGSVE